MSEQDETPPPDIYSVVSHQFVSKITPTPNPEKDVLARWTENGCEALRYKYNLNSKSICIDLGAFHCEWAMKISDLYNNPTIFAFEAIPEIFSIGRANITGGTRLKHCTCVPGCTASVEHDAKAYDNIRLYNYGVGKVTCETEIAMGPAFGAASSLFDTAEPNIKVNMRSIREVILELCPGKIDLMKINIEGAEYDVIEQLLDTDLIILVENLQVQFHRVGENHINRYCDIKNRLCKTHELTYEYPFIWENWKSKK